jgi:hypothetical protein
LQSSRPRASGQKLRLLFARAHRLGRARVTGNARSPGLGLLLLLLGAFACQPKIGDSCTSASDCSVQGDRTCDTTFPGGYCTQFNCGAGTCPDDATCIGFQSLLSLAPECADLQARPRLERSVCLRSCSKDSDCRGGYQCVDMSVPNPWAALVVDEKPGKVCAVAPPAPPTGDTAVCTPSPPPVFPALDAGSARDTGSDLDASAAPDARSGLDAGRDGSTP